MTLRALAFPYGGSEAVGCGGQLPPSRHELVDPEKRIDLGLDMISCERAGYNDSSLSLR